MKAIRTTLLLLTLALSVVLAVGARTAAQQSPIGPIPPPHPSCGEAPLIVLNEDTGQLFSAVSITYDFQRKPEVISFRDGRLFCDGVES